MSIKYILLYLYQKQKQNIMKTKENLLELTIEERNTILNNQSNLERLCETMLSILKEDVKIKSDKTSSDRQFITMQISKLEQELITLKLKHLNS